MGSAAGVAGFSYRVVFGDVLNNEGLPYRVYGLKGAAFEGGEELFFEEILDISVDPLLVYRMAEVFQREQLSLLDFRDAVEDMME